MKNVQRHIIVALLALTSLTLSAQQVTTIYYLENAPMRHTINPALQPVSNGYLNFTPLGWMSLSLGNNSICVNDVLYVDPTTGRTITPLHPNGDKRSFLNSLHSMTLIGGEMTFGFLNFGFRHKEKGYVTIGINERIDFGIPMPKPFFNFLLGGGMTNLGPGEVNSFNLSGFGGSGTAYTEISGGYSYQINEQWTVGGKIKLLLGQANASARARTLNIDASTDIWNINGNFAIDIAGPIRFEKLPNLDGRRLMDVINELSSGSSSMQLNIDSLIDFKDANGNPDIHKILKMAAPSGYGAAIDLGFTYKPIKNLQVSAALNDLGFIYWTRAKRYTASMASSFDGLGLIDYNDPAYRDEEGNFSTQLVLDSLVNKMKGLADSIILHPTGNGYARMVSARFNVALDANFWDNRIGIGIMSATRLYNARLYEEVTIGLSFRPVRWFNIAASYSLMNNGKYSNIGAGLSFMPYDGINLTLAMDYIPTYYAALPNSNPAQYYLPDKTKMVNLALGFSIVWGTNRRDKDKDGVWNNIDMCPRTPRGVEVDEKGCPKDSDRDGIPDYMDECPNTPAEAIGFINEKGCDRDSDGDGVPDYLDQCPNTPSSAWGTVNSVGCPTDTDEDGVPDYIDEDVNTPEAARATVDEKGRPKDSDGDGIADYMDECPNTPAEARGKVDTKGCPTDGDGDGVPDYKDECPHTPEQAIGFVDAKGCELDSDEDGVPDYKDACPMVAGVKANKGCPEVKREVRQLLQKAMQGIEFESGKATIKAKSFPLLDQIAQTFIENSNYIIEVQGHTDNTGKADVNKKLSDQRAHAVMDYLIKKGVPANRMTAVGFGQDKPIADNKTAAGRQKNRRVEFNITFEEVHVETILDHAE